MAMHYLDSEFEFDFHLAGVSSSAPDFRLAWNINRTLRWNLTRAEDVKVDQKEGRSYHSSFTYFDAEEKASYMMVSNKSADGILMPELQHFDYLIKIEQVELFPVRLLHSLRKVRLVNAAFEVEIDKLRMKHHLLIH